MNSIQHIVTADGSHSLFVPAINETYHSTHGAIQESKYVYLGQGLETWWKNNSGDTHILEVGLGTGLNALLTYLAAYEKDKKVFYTALEPYPLSWELVQELNYVTQLKDNAEVPGGIPLEEVFYALHQTEERITCPLGDYFTFTKLVQQIESWEAPSEHFNIVYFDAFAPNKQPEMWSHAVLQKVCMTLAPGGILTTYCAQGAFKRTLSALGLEVRTHPGPPGKKEMVCGIKPHR